MKIKCKKYAWTVTVGEKGQIVIPKEAREIFNINPGDSLIILGHEKKGLAIPPPDMFEAVSNAVFENPPIEENKNK